MSEREIRTYEISVGRFGTAIFSARSPSKARAAAWRAFTEAWEVSFKEFLTMASIKRIPDPPGTNRRVMICGEPATIIYSPHNGIRFMRDGSDQVLSAHPSEIKEIAG